MENVDWELQNRNILLSKIGGMVMVSLTVKQSGIEKH